MPARNHRGRKVHADDRVYGKDERRGQTGEQQIDRFVAVPGACRSVPAETQDRRDAFPPARALLRSRIVAKSGSRPTYQKTAEMAR